MIERIELYENEEELSLKIKGFKYSPTSILVHLEKLDGLKIIAKKSWVLTDDFEAYFTYKDFTFVLFTPFSEIEIEPDIKDTPKEITKEIFNHLNKYKTIWLYSYIKGLFKYALLPYNK